MILVDIYVPSINQQFDFKLDEHAFIADILEEVGEMMLTREEGSRTEIEDLVFCDYETRRVLPLQNTLKQCGIENGCRLVLL